MRHKLRELREKRGWTLEEAATAFGMSRSGYVKLERGERKLAEGHIATAARVYGKAPAEIIGDVSLSDPVSRSGQKPTFGGFVQAGAFLAVDEYFQQDGYEVPEFVQVVPSWGKVRQFAYEVHGRSMSAVGIDDGDWVVAADAADFIDKYGEIESGELVVVERTRAQGAERELTIKEIRFYRDRYELLPRSNDSGFEPIVVPHGGSDDGIEVKIVGVLLTAYKVLRRPR